MILLSINRIRSERRIKSLNNSLQNPTEHKSSMKLNQTSEYQHIKREYYQYTPSRKYSTRIVRFDNGETFNTRIYVGNIKNPNDPRESFDYAFLRKRKRGILDAEFPKFFCVDLFSGCGGLSLGAREACLAVGRRFVPLLAIDKDSASQEVYKKNFKPLRSYRNDIWDIVDGQLSASYTTNEKAILEGLGEVDLLLAGPPCQGHSDLNNHTRREDERNALYERVGRFAEISAPRHILIENVPNIIHSHEHVLESTMNVLVKCGYKVDTGVVSLEDIGIPQKRRRHVLVASLEKCVSITDVIEKHRISHPRDVRWAIGDLECEKRKGGLTTPTDHTKENLLRIKYLFEHDLFDLPDHMRPACHRNGHTYKAMYGRMKYDQPAQTVTSGFGSPGQGRYIHPSQPRTITPHEAARLQFFPDFFDFSSGVKRGSLAQMIGNAVPMKLSYVFCLEFLS